MAQKLLVSMVDDLDGTEADETVAFSLDGVEYAIDLSSANAVGLRDEFSDYIEKARRVGGRKRTRAAGVRAETAEPLAVKRERNLAIRVWARNNGFQDLPDRGRIPAEVVAAYHERAEGQPDKQVAGKTVAAAKKPRVPRKTAAK